MFDIIQIIKKGGVVVMPTDTIYGICADALNKKSVERVYEIRKRNPDKPCIILISKITDLKKFGISEKFIRTNGLTLNTYWPGKVSIILPCTSKKFTYLHRGTNSLAFRLPNKKSLNDILKKTGPLIAPSANIEGLKPAESIDQAKKYFGDEVDLYIAGGRLLGKPSKLIRINENGRIEVLRK